MPKADNEAEEIFQFLPLREGNFARVALGLPVHAVLGGDAAGLLLVGLTTGLARRLGLGRGRGLGLGGGRGGGSSGRSSRCLGRSGNRRGGGGRSSGSLDLDRGGVVG